jgi:hypothetical protein
LKPGESIIGDDSDKKIFKKGSSNIEQRDKKFDIVDDDEIKK